MVKVTILHWNRWRVSRRHLSPFFYHQATLCQGFFSKDFPGQLTLSQCWTWREPWRSHLAPPAVLCNPDQNKWIWISHLKLRTSGWAGGAILWEAFSWGRLQRTAKGQLCNPESPKSDHPQLATVSLTGSIPAPAPLLPQSLQEPVCNTSPEALRCFHCFS